MSWWQLSDRCIFVHVSLWVTTKPGAICPKHSQCSPKSIPFDPLHILCWHWLHGLQLEHTQHPRCGPQMSVRQWWSPDVHEATMVSRCPWGSDATGDDIVLQHGDGGGRREGEAGVVWDVWTGDNDGGDQRSTGGDNHTRVLLRRHAQQGGRYRLTQLFYSLWCDQANVCMWMCVCSAFMLRCFTSDFQGVIIQPLGRNMMHWSLMQA